MNTMREKREFLGVKDLVRLGLVESTRTVYAWQTADGQTARRQ